ncbi:MAG: hypothetical protein Q9174_002116 [Haloplaca sp. 1 TL-2023]
MNLITAVSHTVAGSTQTSESLDHKASLPSRTVDTSNATTLPAPTPPTPRTRKGSSQSRTTFHLAHPPPSTKHRRHCRLRSRTILQIQQINSTARPDPVLDVLPSILYAPNFARKVPQILQRKHGLGLDDLVIVRSPGRDSFPAAEAGPTRYMNEEKATEASIVASICQSTSAPSDAWKRTEIRFPHNHTWRATALSNGAYEFVSDCAQGQQTLARWVPKKETGHSGLHGQAVANFRFSLMDCRTRRHPVIANMNKQSIDVYDRYTIPQSPKNACRHSDAECATSLSSDHSNEDRDTEQQGEPCKMIIETDDHLRTIIAITGIWVALCEGWSPNFRYSTSQVVSDGFSELSSRRRSSGTKPASSIVETGHNRMKNDATAQQRPEVSQICSYGLTSSSPSADLPLATPRRAASTSVTLSKSNSRQSLDLFRPHHYQNSHASDLIGQSSHRRSINIIALRRTSVERRLFGQIREVKEHLADQEPRFPTKDLERQPQDRRLPENATAGSEKLIRRPSRFKSVFARLRRSSTIC